MRPEPIVKEAAEAVADIAKSSAQSINDILRGVHEEIENGKIPLNPYQRDSLDHAHLLADISMRQAQYLKGNPDPNSPCSEPTKRHA